MTLIGPVIMGVRVPEPIDPKPARILYRNHRGEVAWRSIMPHYCWWGTTEWHSHHQWLLRADDLERKALRDFALRDIIQWELPKSEAA